MNTSLRFTLARRALCGAFTIVWASFAWADDLPSRAALERDYPTEIRPLVERYCFECHAKDTTEAEIDLGIDASAADVRKHLKAWIKVRSMLESRQMPPRDSRQPTDAERAKLAGWVRSFLTREAESRAGDPGPVLLRRLNNAEYAYTLRDLMGVATLDPTSEFPIDGGSGEGFTNTGSGQGMSPALVQKYLDAAKSVASHAVLTPTGVRFSPFTTRRDQTDELMAQIQAFYRQFTEDGGGSSVNLQGIKFDTNQGGRLPLRRYLAALLVDREPLTRGTKTIEQLAAEKSLSPRYLGQLWKALQPPQESRPSPLLDPLRQSWRAITNNDPGPLVAQIEASHKLLWKNNSIGHIGRVGGPTSWLEAVSPFVVQQDIRVPLPDAPRGQEVTLYLSASDLGDGREHDVVVWQRPRLEFKPVQGASRPPLLLRDLRWFADHYETMIAAETAKTTGYLQAALELSSAGEPAQPNAATNYAEQLAARATQRQLNAALLDRWVQLTGVRAVPVNQPTGHFKTTVTKVHGYDAVNGWGKNETPVMLTNRSDADISFQTLTVPGKGVTLHPSPTQDAYVAWRSPTQAAVRIAGKIADVDDKCGNGAAWRVELHSSAGRSVLASGEFDNGRWQEIQVQQPVVVKPGDVLMLLVSARNKDHSCDTTHVTWQISETDGKKRTWDLSKEIVDRVLEANPLSDTFGHPDVWHFGETGGGAPREESLPVGSALARWREAVRGKQPAAQLDMLAAEVQRALTTGEPDKLAESERKLREALLAGNGPLNWLQLGAARAAEATTATNSPFGIDPKSFGRAPDGSTLDPAALAMHAPQVVECKIPGGLFAGAEFVATASLHATLGKGGSVQVAVATTKPEPRPLSLDKPILVSAGEQTSPLQAAVQEYRDLFPPTLCYARIVPVDEVVTLTLYHREDHLLRQLMLDEKQTAELNRLWDELLFVAQEPFALAVSFEQIAEFATQDRPDLVKAFEPLRKPIFERADKFRARMVSLEPLHVAAVLRFADQAWRRPVTEAEQQTLRDLYGQLRGKGLEHDAAIRLLVARVLTSPAFLYKLEQPGPGATAVPVTDLELASRLSYFLWSSAPDAELRAVAQAGKLRDEQERLAQTKRLLDDPRVRRLAVEFACQWFHVRDYDKNNDKNEKLFPEFADLRDDMYEETVRFVEDLFRHNGSILDLVDSDHTFMNEALAKHYGVAGVTGAQWRRVEGIRNQGRGGLLGMATILASQSGASRTSPILRGNWVYETFLGEKLPRPPANVPQLPETPPAGLTERQLIEQHSSVEACAKCHYKIDPYGFALEQFDPLGRIRRQKVDVKTTLADGVAIEGLAGLKQYLQTQRRRDFTRQFCKKLLGYALGRETQLSDEPLLAEMQQRLEQGDYRFHVAVDAVVRSRQFVEIRGQSMTDE